MHFAKKTIISLALTALIAGCSDSASSNAGSDFNGGNGTDVVEPTGFDEAALIDGLVNQVFIPANDSFEQSSVSLATAVETYCNDINEGNDAATSLANAKQAWRDNMANWQQLEVMQVGPLLSNDNNLRNTIYSWPTTSECAVDQDVGLYEASLNGGEEYDITRRTNSRRGLDAAEYLLFNDNLNHSCPNDSLAPAGWNARPVQEKQLARCQFAVAVTSHIASSATALKQSWTGEQGFATELTTAGESESQFDSAHGAVNHITDAMFYVDSITKDLKLAAPIGLATNSCGSAACTDDVESLFADNAIDNVKNNLIALQSLFLGAPLGTDAVGFDDYLIAEEHAELANTMATDIQAAIDAAEAFEGSMLDAVNNNPERIQDLHSAVKTVTDNLKSMFITYLSLELPITSAGDAD